MLLNINAAWESGLPVINTLIPFLQWLKRSQYNIHELSAEIFLLELTVQQKMLFNEFEVNLKYFYLHG